MKLLHRRNIVFVGVRNGQATIFWPGVTVGFGIFAFALAVAGMLGWYLLTLATGADFHSGVAVIIAMCGISAGTAVTSSVTGNLKRPLTELPSLD
jgi:hypothetical protein